MLIVISWLVLLQYCWVLMLFVVVLATLLMVLILYWQTPMQSKILTCTNLAEQVCIEENQISVERFRFMCLWQYQCRVWQCWEKSCMFTKLYISMRNFRNSSRHTYHVCVLYHTMCKISIDKRQEWDNHKLNKIW